MLDIVIFNALLVLLYMSLFFVLAYRRRRLDTVDVAWGGGFVLVAWTTFLLKPTDAGLLIGLLVSIWAFRSAAHTLRRSLRNSEDDLRYGEMAAKWQDSRYFWLRAYLSFFVLQGVLIVLVGAPIMAAAGTKQPALGWLITAGALVWLFGFVFEVVADRQLAKFRSNPADTGQVMSSGLWRYSRHPNYFGELLQWFGIGLIACQASWGWIGLIGPLLLTVLIVFVSGIPPIEKRKSDNPDYQDYKRRTSPLIPLFPKR